MHVILKNHIICVESIVSVSPSSGDIWEVIIAGGGKILLESDEFLLLKTEIDYLRFK